MSLVDIQNAFKDFITSDDKQLTSYIDHKNKINIKDRIGVYKSTSKFVFMHCVKDIYPLCKTLIDEKEFEYLVEDYVCKFPNAQRDVTFYGHRFSEHIKRYKKSPEWLFLRNLAQLEWAIYNAYYSQNTPPWPSKAFETSSSKSIDSIRLVLNDSVCLISSEWPLLKHYQLLLDDDTFNLPDYSEKSTTYIIVYRKKYRGEAEKLNKDEWDILTSVKKQNSLADIIQTYGSSCEKYLPRFISKGWICNFEENIEDD